MANLNKLVTLTQDDIDDFYKGVPVSHTAKKHKCNYRTITKKLKQLGHTKESRISKNLTIENVVNTNKHISISQSAIDAYYNNTSLKELAKQYNCHYTTIRRKLNELGHTAETKKAKQLEAKKNKQDGRKSKLNISEADRLAHKKGKSLEKIALKYGCHASTIHRHINR